MSQPITYIDNTTDFEWDPTIVHEEVWHDTLEAMVDVDALPVINDVLNAGLQPVFSCGGDASGKEGYIYFSAPEEAASVLLVLLYTSGLGGIDGACLQSKGDDGLIVRWSHKNREATFEAVREALFSEAAGFAITGTVVAPTS